MPRRRRSRLVYSESYLGRRLLLHRHSMNSDLIHLWPPFPVQRGFNTGAHNCVTEHRLKKDSAGMSLTGSRDHDSPYFEQTRQQ